MKSILYYEPTDADILESIDTEYADLESFDADAFDTFDNIGNVRQELNRKLMLARKYGFDEYADDVVDLLARLDTLRKYGA